MTATSKVGVGCVVLGLVVGFLVGFLDLDHLKRPIYGGLLAVVFITVFTTAVISKRREGYRNAAEKKRNQ